MTNPPPEVERNLPCPFCGGTDLVANTWILDDEYSGPSSEVDALECRTCKAWAVVSAWNTRADPW